MAFHVITKPKILDMAGSDILDKTQLAEKQQKEYK